jgi:FkbM family methyltransferase
MEKVSFKLKERKILKLYSKVFFDIGANDGHTSIPVAQQHPNTIVYSFEPIPEMVNIMKNRISGLPNYKIYQKAVADYNGTARFNVSTQENWGCSSLLEFSPKLKTEWKNIPGVYNFEEIEYTKQIDVDVITLKSFIEENEIDTIDWLHIDTQGNDLKVLKGMGDTLDIVLGGALEAANKEDILYVGQNTKEQCIEFLESKGFHITAIEENDPFGNEVNIFFAKDPNYKNYWQPNY